MNHTWEDSTLFEPQYEVDGTARIFVFDTLSGGLSDSLETGHTDELISLYFSGDSRRLIALDKAGRLHLWGLPDTKRKEIMPDWEQLFEEGVIQKTEGQPAKKAHANTPPDPQLKHEFGRLSVLVYSSGKPAI